MKSKQDDDLVEVRSTRISDKMNELTKNFDLSVSAVNELTTKGSDFEEFVGEIMDVKNTNELTETSDPEEKGAMIEVSMVVDDFLFVRQSLKENTRNAKIILESLTYAIADSEIEDAEKIELIRTFVLMNNSISGNLNLYLKTFQELSTIIIKLEKIQAVLYPDTHGPNAIKDINAPKEVNTMDIIKALNTEQETE